MKRSTAIPAGVFTGAFPARLGELTLMHGMERPEKRSPFTFAVYEEASGKKVLAKRWTGTVKNERYFWLRNEAVANAVLTAALERNRQTLAQFNVAIPRYLGFIKEGRSATMLMEFVQGAYLADAASAERGEALLNILRFLGALDAKLAPAERKLFRRRGPWHMAFMLPIMAIRAMVRYPDLPGLIIRSCTAFYRKLPLLLRRDHAVLIHRDLHAKNVIVDEGRATLLDFELAVLADPLWELAAVAVHGWNDDAVRHAMPDLERTTPHFDRQAYEAFGAYAGVIDLAVGRAHRRRSVEEYLKQMIEQKTPATSRS